jgi:hypothetical protein
MASKGKKKTTMAKLARENRLRERQMDKKAKKDARKNAPPVDPQLADELLDGEDSGASQLDIEQPDLVAAAPSPADA